MINERQAMYLKYLQHRKSPVSATELAKRFDRTHENITAQLRPLVEAGLVKREMVMQQRSFISKRQKAYVYEAVTKTLPNVTQSKHKKFQFHDPFNLAVTQ